MGTPGRKPIGKTRTFRCSNADWAKLSLASALTGKSKADIIRDASVIAADTVLARHVETLRTAQWDDPELQQAAADYLASLDAS
ncbi:hypothetical protein GYB59_00495 [bacterium]|nr:hypothetical protein [bacterium]